MSPKILSANDLAELERWLADEQIDTYMMHRELSDGTVVASLLHKYYPKLVRLQFYRKFSNSELKLTNWIKLDTDVLCKLGISQSKQALEALAQCQLGAIESFLYELMHLKVIAEARRLKDTAEFEQKSRVIAVNLPSVVDGKVKPVTEKMVRLSIYEQALREVESKDAQLKQMGERISQLETELAAERAKFC